MPPARSGEVGVGAAAVSPRPLQEVPWASAAVGWATLRTGEVTSVSAVGAWDGEQGAAGLGGQLRVAEDERGTVALGLEAGWIWLSFDVAGRVHLSDALALYAAPGVGFWGFDLTPRIPMGLEWAIGRQGDVRLRAEAAAAWPDLDPYKRRIHLAFGVAIQR